MSGATAAWCGAAAMGPAVERSATGVEDLRGPWLAEGVAPTRDEDATVGEEGRAVIGALGDERIGPG